jgi:hypothetical protein
MALQKITGIITSLDTERRIAKLRVTGQGKRTEVYFGPELIQRVRNSFGAMVTLSGQWIEDTFDVWMIGK